MASAIVYCQSGGGKTVNATAVAAPMKGKNCLICTDNSSVVLRNFDRKNLEIINVREIADMASDASGLTLLDRQIASGKFDNIIVDNISDYFDLCITEMQLSGKFKDLRQAYQLIYQQLKMMARKSSMHDCNIIFTAWADSYEMTQQDGTKIQRIQPKIPLRIVDNMCGLVNIVAYVNTAERNGKRIWYYCLEGHAGLQAKDQLFCRKSCMPADLFTETEENSKTKEEK